MEARGNPCKKCPCSNDIRCPACRVPQWWTGQNGGPWQPTQKMSLLKCQDIRCPACRVPQWWTGQNGGPWQPMQKMSLLKCQDIRCPACRVPQWWTEQNGGPWQPMQKKSPCSKVKTSGALHAGCRSGGQGKMEARGNACKKCPCSKVKTSGILQNCPCSIETCLFEIGPFSAKVYKMSQSSLG